MEEGGVADDVHIGVLGDELAQALHGELVRLGLAHVEGYLVLKVGPAVGDGVVHVHRVPDEIGEEADGVVVEGGRGRNDDAAALLVIAPLIGGDGLAQGAVHDLPPALDVVPGVDLHELAADALHELDAQLAAGRGLEAGGDVALLHLVGVGLGPGVILAGGVVGGVDLGVNGLELLGVIGAVAVADGVRAPALQQLKRLRHDVYVGRNSDAAFYEFTLAHCILLLFTSLGILKGLVVEQERGKQQD